MSSELRDTIDILINTLQRLNFNHKDVYKLLKENNICRHCFYGTDICDCLICPTCTETHDDCKCIACKICWYFAENCKCRENKPK